MDVPGEVLQILGTDANNKVKFELNFEELQEWFAPTKDLPLVVISVPGTLQSGRSFLLNQIRHYLLRNGEEDQVYGFQSNAGVDPVTSGLWLSKPIIIKRDDDQELAVLLLDSQSVFDESEDSDKIFWICLLLSSCLIINLLTSTYMSEAFLHRLEPFLQYMRTITGCQKPSLIFLMRDWHKKSFKHGGEGGNKYLSNRLEIKRKASEAINTKRWLKNCFKQTDCYLWPGLSLSGDQGEFKGFNNKLSDNFKNCLHELFMNSLNRNKLIPKEINNKFITGPEFCQFLRCYVELFNSTEQPEHWQICAATTKALDLVLIEKLKNQQSIKLKGFLRSNKSFVTRDNLNEFSDICSLELRNEFLNKKKCEQDLLEHFNQEFGRIFNEVYQQNEENRTKFMQNITHDCSRMYKEKLEEFFETGRFYNTDDLTKIYYTNGKSVRDHLKISFNGEDVSLFEVEIQTLEYHLACLESHFTLINETCIINAIENNTHAVNEAVHKYQCEVKTSLDSNHYISETKFTEVDFQAKRLSRIKFLQLCTLGGLKFIETFDKDYKQQIKILNFEFKKELERKNSGIIVDFDFDLIDTNIALATMSQFYESEEEFKQRTLKIEDKFKEKITQSCIPFHLQERLVKGLESEIIGLAQVVANKQTGLDLLNKIKNQYKKNIEVLFKDSEHLPETFLVTKNTKLQNAAIKELKIALEATQPPQSLFYKLKLINKLKNFAKVQFDIYTKENCPSRKFRAEIFLGETFEKYLTVYESVIEDSREEAVLGKNLNTKHIEAKIEVMKSFKENVLKNNENYENLITKLEQMIDKSFEVILRTLQIPPTDFNDQELNPYPEFASVSSSVNREDINTKNYNSELFSHPFIGLFFNTLDILISQSETQRVVSRAKALIPYYKDTPNIQDELGLKPIELTDSPDNLEND